MNCYLLHVPRLPSQPASSAGGWVIDLIWLELAWQYIAMTRNNLSVIWISLIGATLCNKANCSKASKSKYLCPKSAHNLNLTPTKNLGLNLDLGQSKTWLWSFSISLKWLNWNWGSYLNDEEFFGYCILDYCLYSLSNQK